MKDGPAVWISSVPQDKELSSGMAHQSLSKATDMIAKHRADGKVKNAQNDYLVNYSKSSTYKNDLISEAQQRMLETAYARTSSGDAGASRPSATRSSVSTIHRVNLVHELVKKSGGGARASLSGTSRVDSSSDEEEEEKVPQPRSSRLSLSLKEMGELSSQLKEDGESGGAYHHIVKGEKEERKPRYSVLRDVEETRSSLPSSYSTQPHVTRQSITGDNSKARASASASDVPSQRSSASGFNVLQKNLADQRRSVLLNTARTSSMGAFFENKN